MLDTWCDIWTYDLLPFRQLMHELEAKAQERKAEDEAWYRKQELLREAEEQRRKMLVEEEKKLAEQRQRYYNIRNIRGLATVYCYYIFNHE